MKVASKFAMAMALVVSSAWASTPIEVLIPVEKVYVPKGFDSNDQSEVVISGVLPNLCHKAPITSVKFRGNTAYVTVKAMKYEASNPFCPEIPLPFLRAVDLGILDKGKYNIVVNAKTPYEQKTSIGVEEASSDAVDDHIYANVGSIEQLSGGRTVELKGMNPSECLVMDKVEFIDNGSDVYSVLPIMKQVSGFCPMKMTPFTVKAKVPTVLAQKKVLLHVRAMEGKSVNAIFESPVDGE